MTNRVLKLASPSVAEAEVARRAERTLLTLTALDPEVYVRARDAGMQLGYLGVASHRKAYEQIVESYAKDHDVPASRHVLLEADVDPDVELVLAGSQEVEVIVAQLAAYHRERQLHEHVARAAIAAQLGDREAAREHLNAADEMERGEPWPDPFPLNEHNALPEFPVECLPPRLRAWAVAEAEAVQVPLALPAMLALGVLAAACTRRISLHVHDSWREMLCLYIFVGLAPGSRKSAAFAHAVAPMVTFERELAEQIGPERARTASIARVAEQRLRAAESAAARAPEGAERIVAERDAGEAAEALRTALAAVPGVPRLLMGDTTSEAVARQLGAQRDVAIMDAEGIGPLAPMLGRYSDGRVNMDVYLRGHAGDDIRVDRMGNAEPITVHRPSVTLAVTAQPEVLRQVGAKDESRGLGFSARVLWCLPANTVGKRRSQPDPMPRHVADDYADGIRTLLELPHADGGERHWISLSPAGWAELRAFQDYLEPQLGEGGSLESVADWAGKLCGCIARIAGLLHCSEHASAPWSAQVSASTVRAAIRIGEYLLAHAQAALGSMGADPTTSDAQRVMEQIRAKRIQSISRRDLHRGMQSRFSSIRKMEPALALLEELGWIRLRQVRARGASGQTMIHVDVNPIALRPPAPRLTAIASSPSNSNDWGRLAEAGE